MKLELKPEEITLTAMMEQVKSYMYFTGELPESIDMTLGQLEAFEYISTGLWKEFNGIPLTLYGKRIR